MSETKQLCLWQLHEASEHVALPCFKRCFEPTGMFIAVAPNQLARQIQLNSTCMHVCLRCIYQQIHMYVWISCNWLTSTSVAVWLNQQVYICCSCLRPAVMSLCSYQTNGLVSTIAPDHHACILQLHLTSSHVFISCILSASMSVTVSSYQDPMYITFAPDYQLCL